MNWLDDVVTARCRAMVIAADLLYKHPARFISLHSITNCRRTTSLRRWRRPTRRALCAVAGDESALSGPDDSLRSLYEHFATLKIIKFSDEPG